MWSCGGAAGRVTILAERHGTPGPKRTFIPTPSAALQLLQTGHSLRVLDFFSV